MNFLSKFLATLCFIGLLPFAPGTFGSLAAMLFFVFIKPSLWAHALMLLFTLLIGTLASHRAEKLFNKKDSRHIVIDEFAGYAVSVILLPADTAYYIAAFLLFRFFDILKPPPIRGIERTLSGGIGVMADDIIAGVYTNLLLQAWKHLT
ncbi:MAG: phosphatidylglycerophosphatase A [Thermodesulfovibrionales bacterium]